MKALEVTINGPRGDEWERVCGTRSFPVIDWEPVNATLPGLPGVQKVHRVNIQALDSETLHKIAAHLAKKFNASLPETLAAIARDGIPILAEDCTVVLHNPQRWL